VDDLVDEHDVVTKPRKLVAFLLPRSSTWAAWQLLEVHQRGVCEADSDRAIVLGRDVHGWEVQITWKQENDFIVISISRERRRRAEMIKDSQSLLRCFSGKLSECVSLLVCLWTTNKVLI